MFRHLTRTLAAALTASALAASPALATSSAQYRIEGGGWGHGIGMSQYGANGYAQHGMTGEDIIRHYYSGTVIAPATSSPATVRVLLRTGLAPAKMSMTSTGTLQQGAASIDLQVGDSVEMSVTNGLLTATRVRGALRTPVGLPAATDAVISPALDGGVKVDFNPDYGHYGGAYRGTLTGHISGGKVSVVNTLPVDQYVRGVVPGEMPASWNPEALKAQAIAARNYALTGLQTSGYFDLYCTTQSQVYGGVGSEDARTDAAVAATNGEVAHVGSATGPLARTYFYSTSPGRTANNEDVWGGAPISYLRSVASPYEASPYFHWKGSDIQRYTPAQLGAKLAGKYSGRFLSVDTSLRPSGFVGSVNVHGTARAGSISGTDFQYRLGLRSSYFRIYLLSIGAPNKAKLGSYVRFGGVAPKSGVTSVIFSTNGVAAKAVKVRVAANGQWAIHYKVRGKIIARMVRSGLIGPAIAVTPGAVVAPKPTTSTSSFD